MANHRVRHVEAAGDVLLQPGEHVRLASRIDSIPESTLPPLNPLLFVIHAAADYAEHRRTRDLPKRPKHTMVDDITFRTRPTLVTTDRRVLIVSTTVRAHKAKILYEWPHADICVTAINDNFGDKFIQIYLADGWGRNFARHDGSKLKEWQVASVNPSQPVLVD